MQQAQKRVISSATGDWTVKTETQMFRAVYDQEFMAGPISDPSFAIS